MKTRNLKTTLALLLALMVLFTTACSSGNDKEPENTVPNQTTEAAEDTQPTEDDKEDNKKDESKAPAQSQRPDGQSFAEAHDAFQTTLAREENDNDPIPDPPEGLFDLVSYPSKVGDLAAYVSSDPGDDEKHPMIIWVVGGWGNGISDFPWTYPQWDNDQTGSAFWRAGVLTMYPSFRGGNGNPGHYEALFGEVDDIVSAYEYAASLPYVDPNRIYLGGHSTGGTRALLAAEYTDKFRSVFCFGPVDEVKYHNNSQFTFDTTNEEEFTMRSPIHWLDDVKTPTFLIEGSEGNASNLQNIEETSENENIHCYIVDGADHFAALGPATELLAQKILEDTGDTPGITLEQTELDQAMMQDPPEVTPVMAEYAVEQAGLTFSYPYLWTISDLTDSEDLRLSLYSPYDEDNIWDMATMYLDYIPQEEDGYLASMGEYLESLGYEVTDTTVCGLPAFNAVGMEEGDNDVDFKNRYVLIQSGNSYIGFDCYINEFYGDEADDLFQSIIDSINIAQ